MEFIQSTLFSNIIAAIALLLAIASFIYTYMSNRPSVEIITDKRIKGFSKKRKFNF